jgi:nicotinamide riboside kinase
MLKNTAQKFGLSIVELIHFLRIKRRSNIDFHLEMEIDEFAQKNMAQDRYDLSIFIKDQHLWIDVSGTEVKQLQTVFEKLCRLFNDQKYLFIRMTSSNEGEYLTRVCHFFL